MAKDKIKSPELRVNHNNFSSSSFLAISFVLMVILSIVAILPINPHDFSPYLRIGEEIFLAIAPIKKADADPIYDLVGIEKAFEFAKTLPWDHPSGIKNF